MTTQPPSITVTTAQLHGVLTDLARVLDAIPDDAPTAPTPCSEFDIAALRAHVVGWLTAFTDGFSDPHGQCSDARAVSIRGTGAAQVSSLNARLTQVLPQAASRPLRIEQTELPGPLALSMILWEYQVHGWDLARATNQSWAPDPEGLEASLAVAPGMLTPDFQGEGMAFGPQVEVPTDASALERLLGLSGRDPQWAPAA